MKYTKNIKIKSFELGFENHGFEKWTEFLGEAAKKLDEEKVPLAKTTKIVINPDNIEVNLIEAYSINWDKPIGQKIKNLL